MLKKNDDLVENFEFKEHGFFWTLREDKSMYQFGFLVQQERIESQEDKEKFYEEVIEKIKTSIEG